MNGLYHSQSRGVLVLVGSENFCDRSSGNSRPFVGSTHCQLESYKTGSVHINLALRRVRVTIVALERQ